jgi:ectoine hydroxylase-related dioxygenase (phytanoyl-CoA dioxygenase family)
MHDPTSRYPSRSHAPTEADVARTLDHFFKDPTATAFPPLESPFSEKLLELVPPGHPLGDHARRFSREGYTVLDLESPDFDALAARIVRSLAPRYPSGENRRVQEAWTFDADVRALACHPKVLALLEFLYQRRAIPFQTLNFDVGTEQATHSDVIHFYSWPRRYMCGVWVALEDMDGSNGPLHYYVGSHRLPDYDVDELGMSHGFGDYSHYEEFVAALARVNGLERRELHVKKGHALVWAANLLHGGSPVKDSRRSRHSQVTHYFFDRCAWWTPGDSDLVLGRPQLREVVDLVSGRFVTPVHRGQKLDLDRFPNVYRYPRPLPDWVKPAAS